MWSTDEQPATIHKNQHENLNLVLAMDKSTIRLLTLVLISSFLTTASRINIADAVTTIFIRPNGEVVGTDLIQRNGSIYTFKANVSGQIQVEKSDIIIDGNGYTLNRSGDTVDSFGFTLYNVNNVTITDARIINFTNGISISLGSGNNVTQNYFEDNLYSVQVTDFSTNNLIKKNTIIGSTATPIQTIGIQCGAESKFNTILENRITNTYYGMTFDGSSGYNTITKNALTNNWFGIWLNGAPLNTISENTITKSYWGIYLSPATKSNTILRNTIANNSLGGGGGAYFLSGSNSNVVSGNTIANNYYGLKLINSSDNKITQNNFIGNIYHLQPPSFSDYINSFEAGYPIGGNFWSNYTGVDFHKGIGQNKTGSDGLGDTSHIIDANNSDNYPLVGLFSSFQVYADLRVETISNSTINSLEYNNEIGTIKMQVTNASSSQLLGFMRATVPKKLIREPYMVTIDAGLTPVINLNDTLHDNATHRWIYFAYPLSTHEILIQGVPPDVTPPVISILSPETKTYSKRDVPLTFTLNEPTSWIGYSLDNQNNVTIVSNRTLIGLLDNAHTIRVYANDTEGNMGKSAIVSFSVDATPPVIAILSPENTTYNARGVPLTLTLGEPISWIGYSLDNGPNATISGNTTITNLQNGAHKILVYANDTLGNMGKSNTVHFTVEATSDDTTPPVISITSPQNRTYTTTTNAIDILLTFIVNEPVTWRAYSLDSKPNVTINGNTTLTAAAKGTHTIKVYALDTAGNAGASNTVHFSVEAPLQPEPLPTAWIAAAIIVVIALTAFIVYYFRIRKR